MRKYLNMENATLEIMLQKINDLEIMISNNLNEILAQNFKRIIFHVSEGKINKLYNVLKKYFGNNDVLIMIYTSIKKNISIKMNDNFVIINTNDKNILNKQYIYNLIQLKKDTIDLIASKINENINIIVNPIIDINNVSDFVNNLNLLFLKLNQKNVNLNGYLIPSSLMKEHPCNAYLCDGWNCHKKVSCLPRHIFIDENGILYPHDMFYEKLMIGNINQNNLSELLKKYYLSKEYLQFQKYCKIVFIKYLANYPYEYMPLIEFIRKEAEYDK